jgi:3-oxoacyl-[acyl-carrier-protein] synthase III
VIAGTGGYLPERSSPTTSLAAWKGLDTTGSWDRRAHRISRRAHIAAEG